MHSYIPIICVQYFILQCNVVLSILRGAMQCCTMQVGVGGTMQYCNVALFNENTAMSNAILYNAGRGGQCNANTAMCN